MKKLIPLFIGFFIISISSADAQYTKYIIRFKDKTGTPYTTGNPSQYLSARSIARRTRQNIQIDETDLPITPRYIDSVRLAGAVTILNKSKWLNQVCIRTTDAAALAKINTFSFVLASQPVMRPESAPSATVNKFTEDIGLPTTPQSPQSPNDYYNYGQSTGQITIHEGEFLHNNGLHGEGMMLAIMDAGFKNYKLVTAFDSARNNGQVVETYDYVANDINVDDASDDSHGMYCFSIIAANWPNQMVGSCPRAKFFLYRTEEAATESPVEEQNWVAAAERADSIGVDVFSTSLGYTTFDNAVFNHTYADLNGNITIIARANDLAAKKGIISVVAAGNDGTSGWHYIGTPADADSVVAVGAVSSSGIVANFSSYGPSSDGQVKPTLASVGSNTTIAGYNNQPSSGNGTSFATPNLAGLITCFWQGFQDFTNMEIIEALKRSSLTYGTPNDRIGYGIPNFHRAYTDLTAIRAQRNVNALLGTEWIKIYPNPFKGNFSVLVKPKTSGSASFRIYDAAGKLYLTRTVAIQQDQVQFIYFKNLLNLAKGQYTLKYVDASIKQSFKLISY